LKKRLWIQITFHAAPEYQDLLVGQLAMLGFGGFLQEERSLDCYIEQKRWTSRLEGRLRSALEAIKREFPAMECAV